MKCTKCGSDTLKKDGDWLTCLQCGNIMFDTSLSAAEEESPTKLVEQLENQRTQAPPAAAPPAQATTGRQKKTKRKKAQPQSPAEEKPKNPVKETVDFLLPIVLAIIIAILLKTFVFANAVVPTESMVSTIEAHDRIIASRLAYIANDPQRFDIIIFHYPDDETEYFVKRIIGLPGETVEIVDGIVYVTQTDGKTVQLEEDYVTNGVPTGDYGPYTVPANSYFVMGDNRNDSLDSRFWDNTYVKRNKIIGKVKFRYYPSFSKIE